MKIERITERFGARVTAIDLSRELVAEQVRDIHAAMDRHAVLTFPGQTLDDDALQRFGESLGPIEDASTRTYQDRQRLMNARVNDISNLADDGTLLDTKSRHRISALGNLLWHSDSSFKEIPAKYSILHARVIPPRGGETEFADMRSAWDELPIDLQAQAIDLICEHSMMFSRARIGFDQFSEEEKARLVPVPQRLVRANSVTTRKSLYLSAHIGRIRGWEVPEALLFIGDLMEFATQREFVYRHAWSVNDIVMWDNRTTMHRGRPFESTSYPRDLRRVTLAGDCSTLAEPAPSLGG